MLAPSQVRQKIKMLVELTLSAVINVLGQECRKKPGMQALISSSFLLAVVIVSGLRISCDERF